MEDIYKEKVIIRQSLIDYFGDLLMTKIQETEQSYNKRSYSLYYAKIGCMLCVEDRYLIVVVDSDPYSINHLENLSQLNWISFQTRTIDKPPQGLRTQQIPSKINKLLTDKINLVEKKPDRYVYMSKTTPLKIELLFTKEDDNYSNSGTIQSALDTYNCVLSFTI